MAQIKIPAGKKASTIFFIVMILLCVGLLVLTFPTFDEPEDLVQISCSFDTYEIKQHTRSISYDLHLISNQYDLPFQLSFFDGYRKQYAPEDFCDGSTYSLLVLPYPTSYEIYSFFDAEGNLLMTKEEARQQSQGIAQILLTIFLLASIALFAIFLLMIHRPDLFSQRVKKSFFAPRKSI